ncbi:hypothetical protein YDYSG_03410 [Paenibacillus tyrfis]|uniref:hypothetical protein n=1 Tax=Paenibacillus tyrfis TaxID=1501230 RepID=UPI0024929E80|nr:hypothetical protein [Paenibacillus tyrfis]GLI04311.1 hypothetical protein YDYSG_03410 [Paenibacillus tyrfis]
MNPTSQYKLTYEQTTFLGLLRIYGYKVVINWSFFWALIFSALPMSYSIFVSKSFTEDFNTLSKALTTTFLAASAGVLGIVIAALTVTLTLFHNSLLSKMLETKLLHTFLFPYWFAATLWGLSIVICTGIVILDVFKLTEILPFCFVLELLLFLFATFFTIKLTGLIIRLALQRSQINS